MLSLSIGAFLACTTLAACGGNGAGISSVNDTGSVSTLPAAVTVGTTRASLATATSTSSDYTYTAPWGGFSSGSIYVEPADGCGYIPASPAAGFRWPSFLNSLASGTIVTISGTPSYSDAGSQAKGCPTGGIVATGVTAGTASGGAAPGGGTSSGGVSFGNEPADFDPPASWRPYSADSTWNQRLANPDAPRLDPNDWAKVQAMFNSSFGSTQQQGIAALPGMTAIDQGRSGASFPFYFARTSDPRVTLSCTAGYGTCPFDGRAVYIPIKALYSQDSDHHIVIVQPDGTEADVWEFAHNVQSGGSQSPPWYSGERISIGWGGFSNVANGDGWDVTGPATAAGSDGLAGIVRAPELQAGAVNHALAATVFCNPSSTPVYPARHASYEGNCNGVYLSSNQIVGEGARLWIDLTDAQINVLSVTAAQKTILHALHDYGAFVVDSNTYSPLALSALESQIPGAIYGDDSVGAFAQTHLPLWYSWQGLTWYSALSPTDLNSVIAPHLHVLAPCVNRGYPGGQC